MTPHGPLLEPGSVPGSVHRAEGLRFEVSELSAGGRRGTKPLPTPQEAWGLHHQAAHRAAPATLRRWRGQRAVGDPLRFRPCCFATRENVRRGQKGAAGASGHTHFFPEMKGGGGAEGRLLWKPHASRERTSGVAPPLPSRDGEP